MRAIVLCLLLVHSYPAFAPRRASAYAQGAFEGTYVVRQGGAEIGRETFALRQGRDRGIPGSTLTVDARYPGTKLQLTARLERAEAGTLAAFKLEIQSPEGTSAILAAGSGARLIVRTVAKGSEAGKEIPSGPNVLLLDDNIYSLYLVAADAATPSGAQLTAVFPRTGGRSPFTARREAGPARVQLTGGISGTLTLDGAGRVTHMEFPANNVVVDLAGP